MKILLVCYANTCRSPMAEAVLKNLLSKERPRLDWTVDSAGTSDSNVGVHPNPNTLEILREHGLSSSHVSRQVRVDDFSTFDYLLAMDEWNVEDLLTIAPKGCRAKVQLLGEYRMDESDKIIVDPYEKGIQAYRRCYNQIAICCRNFIDQKAPRSVDEVDH